MAEFKHAFDKMLGHEGFPGYVNDPNDPGGETVAGISRKWNPTFAGWAAVDAAKPGSPTRINAALATNYQFRLQVEDHYHRFYWDPLVLDKEPSQRLADMCFDFAVNAGPNPSIEALRTAYERARNALQEGGLDDI